MLDGKGGGRADSAMAGGKDVEKVPLVMQQVPQLLGLAKVVLSNSPNS